MKALVSRPFAIAAIVAAAVPAGAQESAMDSHPAAKVVRDYLNYVLQREWTKSADLVEPKSLETLQKDYIERVKRAQTMDEEEMMLRRVGKASLEDVAALAPREFYSAYHKGLQDRMQVSEETLERVKKSLTMKILSIAPEGEDRVHVLVRTKHSNEKLQIENLELISLIRIKDRWVVGLNEQVPKVTELKGGAPATAPAADPAAPDPAPKKPEPVKPATKPKTR